MFESIIKSVRDASAARDLARTAYFEALDAEKRAQIDVKLKLSAMMKADDEYMKVCVEAG